MRDESHANLTDPANESEVSEIKSSHVVPISLARFAGFARDNDKENE